MNNPDNFRSNASSYGDQGSYLPAAKSNKPHLDDADDFAGESSIEKIDLSRQVSRSLSSEAVAMIKQDDGDATKGQLLQTTIVLVALAVMGIGFIIGIPWVSFAGAFVAAVISIRLLVQPLLPILRELFTDNETPILIASFGLILAILGLLNLAGLPQWLRYLYQLADWNAVGALGEVFGALGQILIAVLAVYIAWRQYVISRNLTIQQNIITQQQTIDSFFQGVSELVLDEEGLLEDWPQERAIAEGRTAAILSSVDASGKAKVIRFLSRARLLTPLQRDSRLGRAILDGTGGYAEDRMHGIRVIDLGVMLAGADLSDTDLRWTDLSDANIIRGKLMRCDLVKANLSRSILVGTDLRGADMKGTRLFYGKVETASPRSRTEPPDYRSGAHTGAVIEDASFAGALNMSPEQRYYCCAWGGSKTRETVPGGCEGIPNKLGR
ncbi:MAG TPA: pentapeptide repeat-containing protein [Leptolyngbyaceae cyanobacterium M33_DOE_097]|uniref:Pentapeptide repeat-containing protein n=1 Tax=Oscillatoriales cyanobacterium SpSt-418 TaxID=2282169 RepID=A0A7C3PFK2_9CYAN|nr:pentapeptide repeat-containing protein [Leptolyngbyaceae cyanobacterium M33_DOE_097]